MNTLSRSFTENVKYITLVTSMECSAALRRLFHCRAVFMFIFLLVPILAPTVVSYVKNNRKYNFRTRNSKQLSVPNPVKTVIRIIRLSNSIQKQCNTDRSVYRYDYQQSDSKVNKSV